MREKVEDRSSLRDNAKSTEAEEKEKRITYYSQARDDYNDPERHIMCQRVVM